MYSIHNRDDLEKLKKLQETKSSLKAERLKEKLGKQDFHYDMEEVFEPVTENQKKSQNQTKLESEKQLQALRDSTQTTTQAIRESSNALNKNLQKSIKEYDEITYRNNQLVADLVNSNQVDSTILRTVSNLHNDKNKSQFSLEPVTQFGEGNPNLFTINPTNPQQVLIKGSTITFENGNTYNLNDPDLQYFMTNTQIDKEIHDENLIHSFLNDMKYNLNYGDKKSKRYYFIKDLINQYKYQHIPYQLSQLGSGFNQDVFLPSDPDELVDQLKLLYFEKVGGNDNPMLSEQIIAIADKLLQYQCITTIQHQNLVSTFTKKDQFVD